MENVCRICRKGKEDHQKEEESSVLIICDYCLKQANLSPLLDRFFLN